MSTTKNLGFFEHLSFRGKINKMGQVAIFIIIAAVIVGVIAIFFLTRGLNVNIGQELNPNSYLRECVEPDLENALAIVSKQGGYVEPDNFVIYEEEKVQYLCYTNNNYKPCIVQQPLLLNHIEKEIEEYIAPKAQECLSDLKTEYEEKGYQASSSGEEINVDIIPGSVEVNFLSSLTVIREESQIFRGLSITKNSEIYDLILTAVSIIDFSSSLGDSETLLYIQYYPDLSIEKIKKEDYTIYKLSNVVSEDEFVFATRSLIWPPGYGLENI